MQKKEERLHSITNAAKQSTIVIVLTKWSRQRLHPASTYFKDRAFNGHRLVG